MPKARLLMPKARLLDLFCGAGGAAMGYYRAGITDITGVDIEPQPRYPFDFVQGDALDYLQVYGHEYDIIHASPPCQKWTSLAGRYQDRDYPDFIADTRQMLQNTGRPYVIENVPGAPLHNPLMLCGTMFGLNVIRHRLFECNPPIYFAPASCAHLKKTTKQGGTPSQDKYICVTGNFKNPKFAGQSMGIDWMIRRELSQAIPPAYTEYIGKVMRRSLQHAHHPA